MKNQPIVLYVLVLLCLSRSVMAQTELFHRVKATILPSKMKQLHEAKALPDHYSYRNGVFLAELPETEIQYLQGQGVRLEVEVYDIARNIPLLNKSIDSLHQSEKPVQQSTLPLNFTLGSMGGFYTYTEAVAVLDDMRAKFPHLVSAKQTIGTTYEGRPIYAVRISDNPDTDEAGEDEWEVTAIHHANEVLGLSVAYYYVWHLLENYASNKEYRDLLDHSELYLVPVINPDGLAYNESTNPSGGGTWRKNRKPRVISGTTHYGVDLNRNYGYRWAYSSVGQSGSNFAGNQYYRGTAAWSELETQAMRDFAIAHQFVAALNFHAWDDSFNYPWNYETDQLPTDDAALILDIANQYVLGNNFETGHFNNTLGYTANGTSDDWLYGEQVTKNKILGFTVEVGRGTFWPASSEISKYGDSLLRANTDMLRMINRYARIADSSAASIPLIISKPKFFLKRYSIQPSSFTVKIIPISPYIISVGADKTFSSISFLTQQEDSIAIELNPSTPNGSVISYVLQVDNGSWSTYDTIVKTFTGNSSLPFGCDDPFEPNNHLKQPAKLFTGVPIKASIHSRSDKDWYRFETDEHHTNLRVVLSGLPADFDLRLYAESGRLLAEAAAKGRANDTLVFNTSQKGSYRLEVFGYKDVFAPATCYSLKVDIGDRPYSPNSIAGSKKTDAPVKVQVFPSPAKDKLYINAESREEYTGDWCIYDNKGNKVKSGTVSIQQGSNLFDIAVNGLKPGIYYFILQRNSFVQHHKKFIIQ